MEITKQMKDLINKWFYDLDDRIKEEILDIIFMDDIIYDLNANWNKLDWKVKLEVWRENNIDE